MRSIVKLVLFVVVALVAYNYFLGTPSERRQSEALIEKAGDLGASAWDLLRGEREKMRSGKYDDALDRLESLYTDLRESAREVGDSEALDDLSGFIKRRKDLERSLENGDELSEAAQRKLEELTADTEELMNEMEAKKQPRAPY